MNGGQDLGGMQGFGPVIESLEAEAADPDFHAEWEERVMSMVVALGACGQWNIDQSRYARESMSPIEYQSSSYYKIWLEGVTKLLLDRGMVLPKELRSGMLEQAAIPVPGMMEKAKVWDALHSLAGAADRPETGKPKFAVGEKIRTINEHPTGHTRLPRYARASYGVITKILGFHVFPDSSGNDKGEDPQWLYQVRFPAQELWGKSANALDSVTLDLWEPHFET